MYPTTEAPHNVFGGVYVTGTPHELGLYGLENVVESSSLELLRFEGVFPMRDMFEMIEVLNHADTVEIVVHMPPDRQYTAAACFQAYHRDDFMCLGNVRYLRLNLSPLNLRHDRLLSLYTDFFQGVVAFRDDYLTLLRKLEVIIGEKVSKRVNDEFLGMVLEALGGVDVEVIRQLDTGKVRC